MLLVLSRLPCGGLDCKPLSLRALLARGSLFASLKTEPLERLMAQLPREQLDRALGKLSVVACDRTAPPSSSAPSTRGRGWWPPAPAPVILRCDGRTTRETLEAIRASALFPGLFHAGPDDRLVDGHRVDLEDLMVRSRARHTSTTTPDGTPWLFLDLQGGTRPTTRSNHHGHGQSDPIVARFSPSVTRCAVSSTLACLFLSREDVDAMIREGARDADRFFSWDPVAAPARKAV